MKKLFLLTLGLSVSLFIYSQDLPPAYYRILQDHILNNTDNEVYLMDSANLYAFDELFADSILGQRQFISYTPHGAILVDSSLTIFYDTATWMRLDKKEYNYDGMNRLDYKTEYMPNMAQNVWVYATEYQHTYIENTDRKDYTLVWDWDYWGGFWSRDDSIVFTYDQQNLNEFEYHYHWNADSGKYFIQDYRHYVYNAQGWVTSDTLFQYWTPGVPEASFLRIYVLDNNGYRIEYRSYQYGGNEWMPVEKHEYTRNEYGFPLTNHRYEWDQGLSDWELIEYGLFNFDENQNMELWRYWEKNETSGIFEQEITAKFFWSLHTVVELPELQETDHFSVYPNPSDGIITIDAESEMTLKIYGMDGKLYSTVRVIPGTNTIDLSDQPPGLYLIISPESGKPQKILLQ